MSIAQAFSALRLALPCAALLLPCAASAHISLEAAGTHLSRYGEDEIKDGPCGRTNGKRGTNVYTYKPGETITISVLENLAHPGYFRIAFDDDGDDAFIEPKSIKPVDPKRACPFNADDQCGESDFYNSPAVLMDNLDPHLASGAKEYTWQVKLPDVECDNCTLQIIQVMEDLSHTAYSPKGISKELFYIEDIYHTCIDLVLKKDATGGGNPTPPAPEEDAGVDDGNNGGASNGNVTGNNGGAGNGNVTGNNAGAGNGAASAGGGNTTGTGAGSTGSGATGDKGASTGEGTGGSTGSDDGSCSVTAVGRETGRGSFAWLLGGATLGFTIWSRRRRARVTQSAV
jgi:hypothetical protein